MGIVLSSPCTPAVVLNSLSSSMWGVLVSKTPRRAAGTVLSVPPDVVRNTLGEHQGKEGRRISVTDVSFSSFLLFYMLSRVIFIPTGSHSAFPHSRYRGYQRTSSGSSVHKSGAGEPRGA